MTRSFRSTFVLCGLVLAALAGRSGSQPRGDDGFTPLFNGRDLTGWTTFVNGRGAYVPAKAGETGDRSARAVRITTTVGPRRQAGAGGKAGELVYRDPGRGGVAHTQGSQGATRVTRSATAESADGWTTVEIVVKG